MTFVHLDLWWIAAGVVAAVILGRRLSRRRALAVTTFSVLANPGYRASRLRHLPLVFVASALALTLIALLAPVVPLSERQVEARGLDIVLVVDLSLSMTLPIDSTFVPGVLGPPPGGARIDAIRDALQQFIARRPDDRIGLVVFSDHAYVVSPLTFDKAPLSGYFELLDPKILVGEGMTAVGDGIDMANVLLTRQSTRGGRNKVIIVFTDGANNLGRDPMVSLEDATALGVRVHVVGVNLQEQEARHPELIQFIRAIRRDGGLYVAADSRDELQGAAQSLDRTEKGTLTMKTYVHNEPVEHWFALAGLSLLLSAIGLRTLPVFIGLH